jgi:hypothetical protein
MDEKEKMGGIPIKKGQKSSPYIQKIIPEIKSHNAGATMQIHLNSALGG